MRTAIIIPARLESTRLPKKLLLDETGRPLIYHSWSRACAVPNIDQVCIATDSPEIAQTARAFGADVIMTRSDHLSGTSRVSEAATKIKTDIIVNLQADEPEIDPQTIDDLINLQEEFSPFASTMAAPFPITLQSGPGSPSDSAAVKVVCSKHLENAPPYALYFSRQSIPWRGQQKPAQPLLHVGIYAFQREALLRFPSMPQGPLEVSENLEQLRILENGEQIAVHHISQAFPGIDTRADYDGFLDRFGRETDTD